jgi:oligogalacturonide transport system substrate-binding protein
VNISFSWWGNDDRNEYTLDAIKDFEKLHKNISVTCNYSEWSGYQTKMDIQMASYTQSDVMQINFAWINQYSQNEDVYYDIYK